MPSGWNGYSKNAIAPAWSLEPIPSTICAWRCAAAVPWPTAFCVMDPDPSWKEMKKAGKQLFRELGELRDAQVMEEWVRALGSPDDPVAIALLQFLAGREAISNSKLPRHCRSSIASSGSDGSRPCLAVRPECDREALCSSISRSSVGPKLTNCITVALRNRSHIAFHRLRIGLKRFRYIVENFLPEQHAAWSDDLKELQDVLGEVHDLDVLWTTALQVNAFPDADARSKWHSRINEERTRRDREIPCQDAGQVLAMASLAGRVASRKADRIGRAEPAQAVGFASRS